MERNFKLSLKLAILVASCFSMNAYSSVNSVDSNGKTVVMNAIKDWRFGDSLVSLNEMVMDKSFNPYIKDKSGKNALDYAKEYKAKPIEYALLSKMYSKKYKVSQELHELSYFGYKSDRKNLIKAIAGGYVSSVDSFLRKNPKYDLNYELENGISPLSATALILDVNLAGKIFSLLVENGADPNMVLKNSRGDSLGHVFCADDNYLMMLLAVSYGYDLNTKNNDGEDVYTYLGTNNSFCSSHIENIINTLNGTLL